MGLPCGYAQVRAGSAALGRGRWRRPGPRGATARGRAREESAVKSGSAAVPANSAAPTAARTGSPGPAAGGSLIATLPGSWYTDPAVFGREQQAIFDGHWLCVARSGDIPDTGQFLAVQAGSESVLIVRQREGGLRAFLNVCPPRRAPLRLAWSRQAARALPL